MAQKAVQPDSLKHAVEITIASLPLQSGTWITNPQKVAEFIEVVARKLDELKGF